MSTNQQARIEQMLNQAHDQLFGQGMVDSDLEVALMREGYPIRNLQEDIDRIRDERNQGVLLNAA